MATTRRDILVISGAAAIAYGIGWWARRPAFEFVDMQSPAGFRRLALGAISSSGIFVGLDNPENERPTVPIEINDVGAALFHEPQVAGKVPIACFSDYNCQYCRVLTREVIALEDAGDVTISWHELPLLGPTSVTAARLALAAEQQDAYRPVHRRLMGGRIIATPALTEVLANEFDLDAARLKQDLASRAVETRLEISKQLASIFAIPGTPALVVGRTLVIGNISPRQLLALVEIERKERGY